MLSRIEKEKTQISKKIIELLYGAFTGEHAQFVSSHSTYWSAVFAIHVIDITVLVEQILKVHM
jgi:hypothetical protein